MLSSLRLRGGYMNTDPMQGRAGYEWVTRQIATPQSWVFLDPGSSGPLNTTVRTPPPPPHTHTHKHTQNGTLFCHLFLRSFVYLLLPTNHNYAKTDPWIISNNSHFLCISLESFCHTIKVYFWKCMALLLRLWAWDFWWIGGWSI